MASNYDPTSPIPRINAPEQIFPTIQRRDDAFSQNLANSWPKSSMETVTVEQLEQRAKLQNREGR